MTQRVSIVTGAASGIGRAIAAALVRRGDIVLVADLAGEAVAAVASELSQAGPGRAQHATVDVRDAAAVDTLVQSAYHEHGRLDLMVNNAGIAVAGGVDELTLDHWDMIIDVNLRGVVHGVHAAFGRMKERRTGQILNTASLAGLYAPPMMAPYAAVKHAVVGLTLSLRAEAAPYGVRVSALCPGFVDTPMLDHVNPGLAQTAASRAGRAAATRLQRRPYPPEALAADALRGLARDQALIVTPTFARAVWLTNRLVPGLTQRLGAFEARRYARRR
jgi:NAD(P)-dependent dehydrogenase (short-subunit alcohol dehydrogenase family)